MISTRFAAMAALGTFLVACGGGSDTDTGSDTGDDTDTSTTTGDPPPDPVAPVLGVAFPPPVSKTLQAQITLRGSVAAESGALDVTVTVNGDPAQVSNGTWSVEVSLVQGTNVFEIEAEDERGLTDAADVTVVKADDFVDALALEYDPVADILYLADQKTPAIFTVNPSTGERRVFSSNQVPADQPAFFQPSGMVLDADNGRLLVIDRDAPALFAVDLVTGERTVLADESTGAAFVRPQRIAYDKAGNRAFVTDTTELAVFSIDLATGATTVLSAAGVPDDTNLFGEPVDIFFDGERNQLIVSEPFSGIRGVIKVDLATGARTVVSSESMVQPHSMGFDADNKCFYITDVSRDAIHRIDLTTDAVTTVSRQSDEGPLMIDMRAAVFDGAGGRLLVADRSNQTVFSVAPDTGVRTLLSGNGFPSADSPMELPIDLDIDDSTGDYLVASDYDVTVVDGTTGERNRLLELDGIGSINVEVAGESALLVDYNEGQVVRVSLADGSTEIVSGSGVPNDDTPFVSPYDAAMDVDGGRLLVLDGDAIVAVDAQTGARTVFSSATVPDAELPINNPILIEADPEREQFLVMQSDRNSLIAVNAQTGARTLLSGPDGDNSDVPFSCPSEVAVDSPGAVAYLRGGCNNEVSVVAVDLVTGRRTTLLDSVPLSADAHQFVTGAVAINGTLVEAGIDSRRPSLRVFDLVSGGRVTVSSNDPVR